MATDTPPEEFIERALALTAAVGPATVVAVLLLSIGARRLPRGVIGLALIMGAFAALSSLAGGILAPLIAALEPTVPKAVGEAFLGAALPEELAKFAILATLVLRHHDADPGRDAALSGAWLGLGFGTFENFFYVTGTSEWLSTTGVRFATAVPAHVALGLVMGLFVGRAAREERPSLLVTAVALPVALHGFYDWPLFGMEEGLVAFSATEFALTGVFVLTLLVLGLLICVPVARDISNQAARLKPAPGAPLVDFLAFAASSLLIGGAVLGMLAAIAAAIWIDPEYAFDAPLAILPFAFGVFWRQAAD